MMCYTNNEDAIEKRLTFCNVKYILLSYCLCINIYNRYIIITTICTTYCGYIYKFKVFSNFVC